MASGKVGQPGQSQSGVTRKPTLGAMMADDRHPGFNPNTRPTGRVAADEARRSRPMPPPTPTPTPRQGGGQMNGPDMMYPTKEDAMMAMIAGNGRFNPGGSPLDIYQAQRQQQRQQRQGQPMQSRGSSGGK